MSKMRIASGDPRSTSGSCAPIASHRASIPCSSRLRNVSLPCPVSGSADTSYPWSVKSAAYEMHSCAPWSASCVTAAPCRCSTYRSERTLVSQSTTEPSSRPVAISTESAEAAEAVSAPGRRHSRVALVLVAAAAPLAASALAEGSTVWSSFEPPSPQESSPQACHESAAPRDRGAGARTKWQPTDAGGPAACAGTVRSRKGGGAAGAGAGAAALAPNLAPPSAGGGGTGGGSGKW